MRSALWTAEDVKNGDCSPLDLGELKPLSTMNEALSAPPEPEPIDAATQADIMETLVAGSVTPQTQAKFNKWADANPGSYFPLLAKYNLAKNMKEGPKALPKLEELTDDDIATLSSDDLKRIFLKGTLGITKKSELDALKD